MKVSLSMEEVIPYTCSIWTVIHFWVVRIRDVLCFGLESAYYKVFSLEGWSATQVLGMLPKGVEIFVSFEHKHKSWKNGHLKKHCCFLRPVLKLITWWIACQTIRFC